MRARRWIVQTGMGRKILVVVMALVLFRTPVTAASQASGRSSPITTSQATDDVWATPMAVIGGGSGGDSCVTLNGAGGCERSPRAPDCLGQTPTIVGTAASDDIEGTPDRDVIAGLGARDFIQAGDGDDIICGDRGDDILVGQTGDDALHGGRGVDVLWGDETCCFSPSPGNDRLDGGPGSNWAAFQGAPDALRVDLAAGVATGEGDDTLIRISNVIGRIDGLNTLLGNGDTNYLAGGDFQGDDTLTGRGRSDVLDGTCCVSLSQAANRFTNDLRINEALLRTVDAVALIRARQSQLGTQERGDTLIGNGGNDTFVVRQAEGGNLVSGGRGSDTATYAHLTSGPVFVVAYLRTGKLMIYHPGPPAPQPTDELRSTENLVGSEGADIIIGSPRRNILSGYRGNDVIFGRQGPDLLDGDIGRDALRGGRGDDTCRNGETLARCEN